MPAFAPILGETPKILILGSMPSRISLHERQYYANPRNAFWWTMSELFGFDMSLDYHSKTQALVGSGVAVWDVLFDCERPGSLDSAIVRKSEVANDFKLFFDRYPSISRVIFNGAAAETLFHRHHKSLIQTIKRTRSDFSWNRCPSTSPAHASLSKHDKLIAWRDSLID